jgi:hypothetical protein
VAVTDAVNVAVGKQVVDQPVQSGRSCATVAECCKERGAVFAQRDGKRQCWPVQVAGIIRDNAKLMSTLDTAFKFLGNRCCQSA